MAGPSVMVRVLGDTSGLARSFTQTGAHAQSAASKVHAAFGTMLDRLNQTGVLGPFGQALSTANDALGQMAEHGKNVSDVMLGAGGALLGVGTLFSSLGSKEKAAHQQLDQAITNTGHSYSEYAGQIDETIKHQEKFGHSAVDTQNALQALTQATHNPAEALKLLGTVSDVAAAQHEDLGTAAKQVGQAYNNTGRLLKQYGIVLDKHTHLTKDGLTATQALAKYTQGQAAAASDTFNGHLKAVTTTIEDQVSKFGEKYGPALQGAGGAMTALATAMKVGQAVMGAFSASEDVAAASADTLAASETAADVAAAPLILTVGAIVLAIAALAVAAYEIYTHWKTIWAGMQAAAKAVWDWIKTNWPYLVGILLGPIGIAAAAIYKNWDTIKKGASDAIEWIKDAWNGIVGFFTALPGRIVGAFSHVGHDLAAPFLAAWNFIADGWNSTVGALSFKIPSWIPGLGGHGFSMPHIPTFATGGIMPWTGLALLHKDETVIPAGQGARTGPAVVVQNAHFHDPIDVDLFMRRAAWAVTTTGI